MDVFIEEALTHTPSAMQIEDLHSARWLQPGRTLHASCRKLACPQLGLNAVTAYKHSSGRDAGGLQGTTTVCGHVFEVPVLRREKKL